MAQAKTYTRSKNFLENSPDRTDHSAINAEFDGVSVSVNGLAQNLALLQNDDGTLKVTSQLVAQFQGNKGDKGDPGEKGDKGDTGIGLEGAKGDVGASFSADARDVLAQRPAHDAKPKGFSFLALDTGNLYFKLSGAVGDWSAAFVFGKGDKGDKGEKGERGVQGIQGVQGVRGLKGDTGAPSPFASVDAGVKTASLIGRSAISARLVVDASGKLGIELTTAV